MSVVLGIDGGGTKTRASIVAGDKVVGYAENGSIKRLRVGAEAAEKHLRAVLNDVFEQAGKVDGRTEFEKSRGLVAGDVDRGT